MAKTVDFKQVAYQTRFGIMAAVKLPTPDEFQKLSDDEKLALYRCIFDTWHDTSNFLTSSLSIDDLLNKYEND
jgi:hypothetical protein